MNLLNIDAQTLRSNLQHYLENDDTYAEVYEYAKLRFNEASNLTAHNWAHAYRDTLNAIVIGEAEGADMSVVLPAITMHDIGFLYGATGRTHGAVGAEKLSQFLEEGGIHYPQDMLDKIASCIRTHKGSAHDEKPEGLEAKVVADADLLDKFGPVGVYQNIKVMTEFNRNVHSSLKRIHDIYDLHLETETGRSLAEPGREFVATFFTDLAEAYIPYFHSTE